MKKAFLTLFLLTVSLSVSAQSLQDSSTLLVEAYLDTYYARFSAEGNRNELQPFTTVSPRNGQFGLNVAQLRAAYQGNGLRSRLTLHAGDIAKATWSQEFPFLQEANVGLEVVDGWWLDLGFFTTHIGTESFLPKNNLLSSTAVATYMEPFYQAGARLSYEKSERLTAALWVVNGYNYFLDYNQDKSVGFLLGYQFTDHLSLHWTSLFGNEGADSLAFQQYRSYMNLYLNGDWDKWKWVIGGDFGRQSNSSLEDQEQPAHMFNVLATLRYQFHPRFSVSTRGEIFEDEDGFISGLFPRQSMAPAGLKIYGLTLGGEYRPAPGAYLRMESRLLQTGEGLYTFHEGSTFYRQRWEVMLSMGIVLERLIDL